MAALREEVVCTLVETLMSHPQGAAEDLSPPEAENPASLVTTVKAAARAQRASALVDWLGTAKTALQVGALSYLSTAAREDLSRFQDQKKCNLLRMTRTLEWGGSLIRKLEVCRTVVSVGSCAQLHSLEYFRVQNTAPFGTLRASDLILSLLMELD